MLLYKSFRSAVLILFALFAATDFISCKQSATNAAIKNNIEINELGLHVESAYLTNGDSSIISDKNKVHPGELVCLRMSINGWQEKNGKVFLDASQKATTSSGFTLTENHSLFGALMVAGVLPQDAKRIILYQTMGKLKKPVDYILISFKVWDKSNNNFVAGSYKLYM